MKRFLTVSAAFLLFLVLCGVFYLTREINIFDHRTPASSRELVFEGSEISDFSLLTESIAPFWRLEKVSCGTFPVYPEEASELKETYPHIEFEYDPYIRLYTKGFPLSTREIDLTPCTVDNVDELIQKLPSFCKPEAVILGADTISEADFTKLSETFPEINIKACVIYDIYGVYTRDDAKELVLSGAPVDKGLGERLKVLKSLSAVELYGTNVTNEDLHALYEVHPQIEFKANAILGGKLFDTASLFIDLNWVEIDDFENFKKNLKLFTRLERIEMCGCKLSNEQMEELCQLFPDTRFVWRVYMGQWSVRTDAVAFSVLIRNYEHKRLTSEDIEVLKYCTDLQALDIGHQAITDISVIGEYLTNLRVLILADNRITDLSPLTNLPHLHYLEFFVNQVTDLTPLASCRQLVDLNISYNYRISDITPLLDLPLLERLWLEKTGVSRADVALLKETYPNARIINVGEGSVDQGWRTHRRYYAMLNMYYNDYISEEFSKYDDGIANN